MDTEPNEAEAATSLARAYEAYSEAHYDEMIVPANIAIELSLNRLFVDFLQAQRKNGVVLTDSAGIDRFLKDGATYGYQLNVLAPLTFAMAGLPLLPTPVRQLQQVLKKRRDEIAHSGKLGSPLTQSEAADLLTAALFGFHYVAWARTRMLVAGRSVAS